MLSLPKMVPSCLTSFLPLDHSCTSSGWLKHHFHLLWAALVSRSSRLALPVNCRDYHCIGHCLSPSLRPKIPSILFRTVISLFATVLST